MTNVAGTNGVTNTSATSQSVPLPVGWRPGHLCVLVAGSGTATGTLGISAGWTPVDTAPVDASLLEAGVWYRVLQAGDVAPTITYTVASKLAAATVLVAGYNADSPISWLSSRWTRTPGSPVNTITAGTVTTTTSNQLVLGFFMERSSPASGIPSQLLTPPAGMTVLENRHCVGGGAPSVVAASELRVAAGATGTRTATYDLSSDSGYGLMLAVTPGSDPAPEPGTVAHGWAGAQTPTGFTVVAKTAAATSIRLAVATNLAMTQAVTYSAPVVPDSAGYVRLPINNLAPGVKYFWQLQDTPEGGGPTLIGTVGNAQTLPAEGPASYRFAFGACLQNVTDDSAMANVLSWDPLFLLHQGDFHYRDPNSSDPAFHRAKIEQQIQDYPNLKAVLSKVPTYYTRSDHDAGPGDNGDSNNDSGLASIASYRQVVPYPPLAAPDLHSLHFSFTAGRVRYIVLDNRSFYRSPGADPQSVNKTLLGAEQKAWLFDQLLQPEPVKVIVSDTAWIGAASLATGIDKWWAYDNERTEIGAFIAANKVRCLMLHGDMHSLVTDDGRNNHWGGFVVWGAAPFANVGGGFNADQYQQSYNVGTSTQARQYGRVTVTDNPTADTITLTYSGWDVLGNQERVGASVTFDAAPVPPPRELEIDVSGPYVVSQRLGECRRPGALSLPHTTVDYLHVDIHGAPTDITADPVEIALLPVPNYPVDEDWVPAQWDPTRPATVRYLRTEPDDGQFSMWVRIHDHPTTPVRYSGVILFY